MLYKFRRKVTVQGFTFQKGWWGEFSTTDHKLIRVYAYPNTEFDLYNDSVQWSSCRVFYPFDGGFVPDHFYKWSSEIPEEVWDDFCEVAYHDFLEYKESIYDWYYDED